jgi:hypothetical protein
MPDTADLGNEAAEILRDAAEKHAVHANKPITASTHCLSCDAPLVQDIDFPRRWCDAACRDDWERRK